MAVVKSQPRISQHSLSAEIERLTAYVRRMESRYEVDSATARAAVARGRMKETAEVSRWLESHNVLMSLKGEPEPVEAVRTRRQPYAGTPADS